MDLAAIKDLGYDVLLCGAIALWISVVLRLPGALKSIPQRRLVIAAAGLAGSVTVYMDPVTAALAHTPLASDCGIVMNIWGVLSSAFILDFVLAALSRRRPIPVYTSALLVSGILIALNAIEGGQAGCVTSLALPWYSPFWWLLSLAHVGATLPITILCVSSAIETGTRWSRASLILLATGFASSTLFWAILVLGFLLTRSPALAALFALNIGVTTSFIAAGTALPLLARLYERSQEYAARRELRPLWRRLVRAVPHVQLPAGALRGVASPALDPKLYRTVIEIRDALLLLRGYIRPLDELAAQRKVEEAPARERDALLTACLISAAISAKAEGYEPRSLTPGSAPDLHVVSGDTWDAELEYQTRLARAHRSPLVLEFARQQQTSPAFHGVSVTTEQPE